MLVNASACPVTVLLPKVSLMSHTVADRLKQGHAAFHHKAFHLIFKWYGMLLVPM